MDDSGTTPIVNSRDCDSGDSSRIHFLMLCARDFWDVGIAADFLLNVEENASNVRVRRMVEVGAIVAYARPFTQSKWERHLEPSPELDPAFRKFHDDLMRRRNQVYAHTDRTDDRLITNLQSAADIEAFLADRQNTILHEEFDSLADDGLRALRRLAQTHFHQVDRELEVIAQRNRKQPTT